MFLGPLGRLLWALVTVLTNIVEELGPTRRSQDPLAISRGFDKFNVLGAVFWYWLLCPGYQKATRTQGLGSAKCCAACTASEWNSVQSAGHELGLLLRQHEFDSLIKA